MVYQHLADTDLFVVTRNGGGLIGALKTIATFDSQDEALSWARLAP